MNCPNCGSPLFTEDCYCSYCGARVYRQPSFNQDLQTNIQQSRGWAESSTSSSDTPQPPKTNTKTMVLWVVSILLALGIAYGVFTLIKQHKEESLWETCLTNKQIDDLRHYLEEYPEGNHSLEAHELLDQLVNEKELWEKVSSSDDEDYLRSFIRNNPGSIHLDEAKALLDDAVWSRVVAFDTKDAYGEYLNEFSHGKHSSDARSRFELKRRSELTTDERNTVKGTVENFLSGLQHWNLSSMLMCCNSEMSNFMGKRPASQNDVKEYFYAYRESEIDSLDFSSLAVDVKKIMNNGDKAEYQVDFTTTRTMWRNGSDIPTKSLINGHAIVDERFRFKELSMDKEGS